MIDSTTGTGGQLSNAPSSVPPTPMTAQADFSIPTNPNQPSNAVNPATSQDPVLLARQVIMDNYDDPSAMSEHLWQLKERVLAEQYGIRIEQ